VLIKEPYFKIIGDGEYGLRVDHASDIVWVEEDKRIPLQWRLRIGDLDKSADDWKLEGNEKMKERRVLECDTKVCTQSSVFASSLTHGLATLQL
jgi:hypothetical protein